MREIITTAVFLCLTLQSFALEPLKEAEDRREVNSSAIDAAINSTSATERAQAARALGRIQKPDGIDPLLKLLRDTSMDVQREAIFALGQLGWDASFANGREAEIAEQLAMMKFSTPSLRRLQVEALGKLGLGKAPTYLVPFLKDGHADVRAEALLALYRYRLVLRLRDPSAAPALLSDDDMNVVLSLTGDHNRHVQKMLAYYFWRVKDDRGKALLLTLTGSAQEWTKFYAVSALAKYSGTDVIEAASKATEDDTYTVRTAAIQAITALKAASSLDDSLRGDPSQHVRMAYAQAMASLAPATGAKEQLKSMVLDSRNSVRAEAIKALATFADVEAQAIITNALINDSFLIRSAAVASTGALPASEQKSALQNAAQDSDVRVRVAALETAATIADSYAYDLLTDALHSAELSERGTAVASLSSRQEPTRFADAHFAYQKSSGEKWIEAREEIVKLWTTENSDQTTSYLRDAVLDPSVSVANLAAAALTARGIVDFPAPTGTPALSFSPYRELTFKKNPTLFLETSKGTLTLELYPRQAPIHVANMVGFAQDGKYDGLPIHRVVSNFVIQGGDPDQSGWGSAGYSLRAEINPVPFERGTLGMPRSSGFDTGGIQFFINHIPTPHLDGQYTVFGKVTDGLDVIDRSEVGDLILRAWVEL